EEKRELDEIGKKIRTNITPLLEGMVERLAELKDYLPQFKKDQSMLALLGASVATAQILSNFVHQQLMTKIVRRPLGRSNFELIGDLALKDPNDVRVEDARKLFVNARRCIDLDDEASRICSLLSSV
ncbi:unnamed protein product, partial [marine sediment metagenome]